MLKYNQGIDKHVHKVRKTYAWMCFIHVFVCGCVLYMSLGVDVFYTSLCAWMCFIHVFVCSRMAFCACGPSSGKQTKKHLFRKQKHKQLSRNKHFTNKKYAFILCQLFVIVIPFSRKLFFYHFVR